jgi:Tol biopolymer transport system component
VTLVAGTRLGPYEIVAPLGAGGMGEVWRAKDTRLGREVAIKVLPAEFAADADRLRRFEQEARAASALNHPNIVTLYEVGTSEAGPYLVLEKIEGRSLHEILRDGPLPLRRLLTLASQIAEGLAKAHGAGIVHRDLKPANVMVTDDGFAKILDFGLARLSWPELEGSPLAQATTLAEPTASGMILGTPGYLSPEQAAGRPADFRADQFALGALVYEMATGERPFRGETTGESLAAVLRDEPESLRSKNAALPAQLGWIVDRCLAKDPNQRYASTRDLARDLADLRDHLSEIGRFEVVSTDLVDRSRATRRAAPRYLAVFLVGVLLASALALLVVRSRPPASASTRRIEATLLPPPGLAVSVGIGLALSPDGERVVFGTGEPATRESALWLRSLGEGTARKLPGTEGAVYPFWSPDSRTIAFFAQGKLRKLGVDDAAPVAICDAAQGRGGSWNRGGEILFGILNQPLQRVMATGGPVTAALALDAARKETDHRWPYFLPDDRHFVYAARSATGSSEPYEILAGSLDGGSPVPLMAASSSVAYSPPGFLLSVRPDRTLVAQPFDPRLLQLKGDPISVADRVFVYTQRFNAAFAVSNDGTLVFQAGGVADPTRLVWFDRAGHELETLADGMEFSGPRLSLDGTKVVASASGLDSKSYDLWEFDAVRKTGTRVTNRPETEDSGVWSPDGRLLFYRAYRSSFGVSDIFRKRMDSEAAGELLFANDREKTPCDVSPDGRTLLFQERTASGDNNLWLLGLAPGARPSRVRESSSNELCGSFSPDGRWLALTSNESGAQEIYLQSLEGPAQRTRISTAGGLLPRWSRAGRELFYRDLEGKLMAVEIENAPRLRVSTPRPLFLPEPTFDPDFDASADGQRFLLTVADHQAPRPPLTLLVPWLPSARP